MTTETTADAGVLRLGGALDIYGAEQLREALLARFREANEVVIGLGKVESCDTAGIQLLLSARRMAAEGGRALRFDDVPAAVRASCQCLGLPEDL